MNEQTRWNESYASGDLPWDTDRPSTELQRVLGSHPLPPCRALDLGCGTGTNSVWLASQGFDVTGLDFAPLAIERAVARAQHAAVAVRFLVADVLATPDLGAPFGFFFDRGCYHVVRREHPHEYVQAVARWLAPGAVGLILTGNAREPHSPGPPVVTADQIHDEWGREFRILELTEFRFDSRSGSGEDFLGWSCRVTR